MVQPRRFGSKLPPRQSDTGSTSISNQPQKDYTKTLSYKLKLAMLVSIPVMILVIIGMMVFLRRDAIEVRVINCPYCQHKNERTPEEAKDLIFFKCDSCDKEFIVNEKKALLEGNKLREEGRQLIRQADDESDIAKRPVLYQQAEDILGEAIEIYNLIGDAARYENEKAVTLLRYIRGRRTH